jgi:hypothetical protein
VIATALINLTSSTKWMVENNKLTWLDETQTQPTDAEITAEVTRLQAEYDANQYQRDRAKAYPSLTEQADMAYWDRQNNTTTLDDAISAVKAEFPKG